MIFSQLLERSAKNNASASAVLLIKKLKLPITSTAIINDVENHPDYPSLLSISDSLKKWKIDNIALQVKDEKLDELPTPFIAHTKNGGGNFVVVTNVNAQVEYIEESRSFGRPKIEYKSKEDFKKEWTNIALFAEASDKSGEKNYAVNRRKELIDALRIPLIVITCLILIIFSVLSTNWANSLILAALLLIKLAGSIVTGLLLWFEIDKSNSILKQVCNAGKSTNCTAILSSKSSKLFNWLSWSEVGFFYFAGSFLYLLISATQPQPSFSLLAWLNLFALPFTVFSLYYQWRIAKQWCPLCLIIQAFLITEFLISYFGSPGIYQTFTLLLSQLITLVISLLLPIFFWMATKKTYIKAQEAKGSKKELARLKHNKEIFNALLNKQKTIITSPEGLGITIGNPAATNTVIKVCNPYCGPCAHAYKIIDEILASNEDLRVQIIFTATDDEKDFRSKPVRHLMAIYEKGDVQLMGTALHDWYGSEKKDYDGFEEKYNLIGEVQKQGSKIRDMDTWCKQMDIEATPTFFINGYRLPGVYKAADLKYLLS